MAEPPVAGDIWRYPYLWAWQAERGETEGRKPRPVTLVAVIPVRTGETRLYLLPITGTEPVDVEAIEIPQTEIRRAGLDGFKRLWIIVDEYNRDILEASFYFDPAGKIGSFSRAFRARVAQRFLQLYQAGARTQGVKRTE